MPTEIAKGDGVLAPDDDGDGVLAPDEEAAADAARKERQSAGLMVAGGFVMVSLLLLAQLWVNPVTRYLKITHADQQGFEWIIQLVTHSVLNGQNPLFTDMINMPLGINVMAQTSIMGLSIPLIPVTLLFGPSVTFAVILTGSLAGTAIGWYWLFSRHLVPSSRAGAVIAAAFCAFAPPMISHANGGHLNYVAQFLLPVIVWRVIKLREPGRWLRNGVIAGLLITWQIFIGEEPLLVAAMGLGFFTIVYALIIHKAALEALKPFLAGLGVAVLVTVVLAGYPLWYQFYGPQSYNGLPHAAAAGNDLYSLTTYGSQIIGGGRTVAGIIAMNPTEENGFFGWALLILTGVVAAWLWRGSALVKALAITAGTFLVLSLGTEIIINTQRTGIPGPWKLFSGLPLVGSILPGRLTFVAMPAMAAILALGTARIVAVSAAWRAADSGGEEQTTKRLPAKLLWFGAIAAVMVPLIPVPLPAIERRSIPEFFTAGTWKQYIRDGRSLVSLPVSDNSNMQPVRWQLATNMGFRNIEGYFVGPHGPDKVGFYNAERRPTGHLISHVWRSGELPQITDDVRNQAKDDLTFWKADVVVLPKGEYNEAQLYALGEALFGPGKESGGVWVWDVKSFSAP
ncbi:hypothetical protein [Longispora albida]|uniref:hypothetical protein n=1 Tax=Longispora albida TaxID=203523 RepID=UPI000364EBB6|nr:hypothetical protein [Longispora albida]